MPQSKGRRLVAVGSRPELEGTVPDGSTAHPADGGGVLPRLARMRGRAVILAVACGVGLAMLGCARAERPESLPPPSSLGATEPAPEGAVYRAFYRGGVDASRESRVRWLADGTGFELSIGGSGNCPTVPMALDVLAADSLRIRTQMLPVGSGRCQEDYALWSFVFDTPSGIDAERPVRVDVVLERGTATEELEPIAARRARLLE